ncbi:MAG: hypothetical protein MJK04_30760, partial [Psychrosphaera sp.]|nr:hypothetical protein [Psychrosphaera sp.]
QAEDLAQDLLGVLAQHWAGLHIAALRALQAEAVALEEPLLGDRMGQRDEVLAGGELGILEQVAEVRLFREVVDRIRDSDTDVVVNLTAGMGGDMVFGNVESPLPLNASDTPPPNNWPKIELGCICRCEQTAGWPST